MDDTRVRGVGETDQAQVYATLVLAFAADPCERWLYPSAAQYLTHFPTFLRTFAGPALTTGTAWRLDDFAAVSLWLPPGSSPDGDAIVEVLTSTVNAAKHDDLFDVIGQMDAAHPAYPHWYLPWFGTDPASQGRGLGSELMAYCLDRTDADHLPTYLETPNPRTIPFYRRHGFEVVGEARAGACPPVTCMLRAVA